MYEELIKSLRDCAEVNLANTTVCFGQLTEVITVTVYGAAKRGKESGTKCLRGCRSHSR